MKPASVFACLRTFTEELPVEREPTIAELRQAVQELVQSGELVAVEEIDPATGDTRLRYYHHEFAPRPH